MVEPQDLKLWLGNVPFASDGSLLLPDALAELMVEMQLPPPVQCMVRRGTNERVDSSYAIIEHTDKADLHKVLTYSGAHGVWWTGFPFLGEVHCKQWCRFAVGSACLCGFICL